MSTDLDPEGVTRAYIPIDIPNSQLVEFACLLTGSEDESILRDLEEVISGRITTGIRFDGFPEMSEPVVGVGGPQWERLTDYLELW